jgi:hypothetical protein
MFHTQLLCIVYFPISPPRKILFFALLCRMTKYKRMIYVNAGILLSSCFQNNNVNLKNYWIQIGRKSYQKSLYALSSVNVQSNTTIDFIIEINYYNINNKCVCATDQIISVPWLTHQKYFSK